MTDNSEFRPIHPNITDTSMIHETVIDIPTSVEDKTIKIKSSTWQKTVVIGVLTVFIIILCIMLLYQLYKHYITDTESESSKKTTQNTYIDTPPNHTATKPQSDTKAHNGEIKIPDNINILDNNFLDKHIKKQIEPLSIVEEVDSLLEEHNKEIDEQNETVDIKTEEVYATPILTINKCSYTVRKRGKKNTICGKPCAEELCDDHKLQ